MSAASQTGFMKPQNPNRIAELRLAKRWNQRELADALGIHYMTISKLERGGMRLTQDWMERLAYVLDVNPEEIIADSPLVRSVYIGGSISDDPDLLGSNVDFGRSHSDPIKFEINLGVSPPKTSVFYFVTTQLYQPLIHSGDVARFTSVENYMLHSEALFGRLCILETDDPRGLLIGVVERAREPHMFDLRLPAGGHRRGIRPDRVHVLSLVVGLPDFRIDDDGVPF